MRFTLIQGNIHRCLTEYGKYVTECMLYENDGEEVIDLEGRKTGGTEISRNTLSIENVYAIRA